jgi:hypothetical protein
MCEKMFQNSKTTGLEKTGLTLSSSEIKRSLNDVQI